MNAKKLLTISIVLALSVLIALGGFWQPAAAGTGIVRLEKDLTIGLGTRGLHVPNILQGMSYVNVEKVDRNLPSRFIHLPITMKASAYGGPYKADGHTLLLLHLDGSYDGVKGEVGTALGTEFTFGRFGQGVLVDGNDTLTYPVAGNIHTDQGAVEFWLRPNWDGDAGGNYTLFRWGDGPDYIHLRKDPISNLVFDRFYGDGSCGAPVNVATWRAGEWHHLAITWQGVEISLYVDGQQVAQTTCSGSPEPTAENFYIGSGSPGEELPVDAVIDELRISDLPRVGKAKVGSPPRP